MMTFGAIAILALLGQPAQHQMEFVQATNPPGGPFVVPASPPAPSPPAPNSRARPARPLNVLEWITTNDYPVSAMANNQSGTVGYVLVVGRDGRVEQCSVNSSSGVPALDNATCGLISVRARFDAARDYRGRRIQGRYANRVIWRMPSATPPPIVRPPAMRPPAARPRGKP